MIALKLFQDPIENQFFAIPTNTRDRELYIIKADCVWLFESHISVAKLRNQQRAGLCYCSRTDTVDIIQLNVIRAFFSPLFFSLSIHQLFSNRIVLLEDLTSLHFRWFLLELPSVIVLPKSQICYNYFVQCSFPLSTPNNTPSA